MNKYGNTVREAAKGAYEARKFRETRQPEELQRKLVSNNGTFKEKI